MLKYNYGRDYASRIRYCLPLRRVMTKEEILKRLYLNQNYDHVLIIEALIYIIEHMDNKPQWGKVLRTNKD
jgi:hypothetical protein